MKVDVRTGLLDRARHCPSPNCDDRPEGTAIDLVVVHNISLPPGEFGGDAISAFFTNRLRSEDHAYFQKIAGTRVSAHVLIRRDGEVIQYVPFYRRAWHAGASQFQLRSKCNDFSIGIEVEGTDELPYEAVQYDVLANVIVALMRSYPGITQERVVGHSDISPDRKTDPGPAFDWARLYTLVAAAVRG